MSNQRRKIAKATELSLVSSTATSQQVPDQRNEDGIQVSNCANQNSLPNEGLEVHFESNATSTNQNSEMIPHSFHSFDPLLPNGTIGPNMPTQVGSNSNYQPCPDPLPFDSLNVQDLWTWMGDLDGYDNYVYHGSYENNGIL